MSFWQVSQLVAHATTVLCGSSLGDVTVRNNIQTLESFEETFDGSDYRAKVSNERIARKYTYQFKIEDQTIDYQQQGAYKITENTALFDIGSELWHQWVKEGKIQGDDAIEPKIIGIQQVFLTVAQEAAKVQDYECLQHLCSMFPMTLGYDTEQIDENMANQTTDFLNNKNVAILLQEQNPELISALEEMSAGCNPESEDPQERILHRFSSGLMQFFE